MQNLMNSNDNKTKRQGSILIYLWEKSEENRHGLFIIGSIVLLATGAPSLP
jgi:hypothetical protein